MIPETLPGHWATPDGQIVANTYAALTREDLAMSNRSDLELATAIFLSDLPNIALQSAVKQRIRWLSVQLALARQS